MMAAGVFTPAQLVERCRPKFTDKLRFTRQTAARWLKMDTAELSMELGVLVAECLGARITWLVTGKGAASREHIDRALAVLDRLDDEHAEKWLKAGERMAG